MRLTLQFIHQRKIPWIGLSVLFVTFIAALFVIDHSLNVQSQLSDLQTHSEQLAEKLKAQRKVMAQSQMAVSPAEELRTTEQQKIIKSLQYPWNRVLAPMELTDAQGVAILSFTHDQVSGISQLKVEALDTPSIIRFVEKMNEGDDADHWYIASYQTQNQSIPATVKANILNQ